MLRCFLFWVLIGALVEVRGAEWDLVIVGGTVVDGSGKAGVVADVGVKGGRIGAIGKGIGTGVNQIDARGKVVAPGFIDVHTHSEDVCEVPGAENFLRMGVTTIVTGNCGTSETDVGAFFEKVETTGVGVNVAMLIGHNSVRRKAMGGSFLRAPTGEQMEVMKGLVDEGMKDGAVGLSTGLIYNPGAFAKTEEVLELAKVAAAHDGVYVSHMRSETVKIFEAIEEFMTIARGAKIRAQVSHLKLSGPTAWGKAAEVLAVLDKGRAEGLRITHDQYAYTASSTGLAQLIPDVAREGTREDFRARIADPVKKATIVEQMERMREHAGREDYGYAVIARYAADPALNGMSLREAAKLRRGSESVEAQVELILEIEANGGGSGVFHGMNEQDLQVFMRHPLTMVASDGGPRKFGEDVPHPRSYGNNARVLGRYVRELKVLELEEAVRKMSALPAEVFQLKDRGMLKAGAIADVVVFDPATVNDPSVFEDPHHYAEGFSAVLVNGVPVIEAGEMTEARPGVVVRRGM
jgi:N-acyl-D-amino-acid deacylase